MRLTHHGLPLPLLKKLKSEQTVTKAVSITEFIKHLSITITITLQLVALSHHVVSQADAFSLPSSVVLQ